MGSVCRLWDVMVFGTEDLREAVIRGRLSSGLGHELWPRVPKTELCVLCLPAV